MRNIELKVKVECRNILRDVEALNPIYMGALFQRDTYYLLGDKRLKLREEKDKIELIYYRRENKDDSKDSTYFVLGLSKYLFYFFKSILNFALGVKKIVEKQRELYVYKNTRIHLDSVQRVGEFLELETVVKDKKMYKEYQREHAEIISILELNNYPRIACSYSDF